MKTKSIGRVGFIIGGIALLISAYSMNDTQTIFPWYIKVLGGVVLIIYGIKNIMQSK